MITNLNNNFIKIDFLFDKVKNSNKNFKDNEASSIIDKILNCFWELKKGLEFKSSPLIEKIKSDSIQILLDLNHKIHDLPLSSEEINNISQKILKIKKSINQKTHISSKIDLKIAFFCDIDCQDHNGVIAGHLLNAIRHKTPFITTRSIVGLASVVGDFFNKKINLERTFIHYRDEWEVYEHHSVEYGNELLVFFPKSLLQEKKGNEKLKELDFATDGSLKKTSLERVLFEKPKNKNDLRALFQIFQPAPKKNKLFFIAGHGSKTSIGGLKNQHYLQFIDFLQQQKCQGLAVSSCQAGGESSMLHFPRKEKRSIPRFGEKIDYISFPVFVHSLGEFITYSKEDCKDVKGLLNELEKFLTPPIENTPLKFKIIFNTNKNTEDKATVNLVKVYFPHAPDSPGGFRSIGEGKKNFSLTYHKMCQEKVLIPKKISTASEFLIEQRNAIEIYPLVIDLPLTFNEKNSILISMIPGKSHHYFQKIKLMQETFESFLNNHYAFHETKFKGKKAHFIEQLTTTSNSYEQVIFYIQKEMTKCLFRKNGSYFYADVSLKSIKSKRITLLQYAIESNRIRKLTTPSRVAVRVSTGGQQCESMFLEKIRTNNWWGMNRPMLRPYLNIIENDRWEELFQLTMEDCVSLAFYVLRKKRADLSLKLLKNTKLSVDVQDLDKTPLICESVKRGNLKLINFLIQQGVNINVRYPDCLNKGFSPLHLAAKMKDSAVLRLLLKNENADLEIQDIHGWTPLQRNLLSRGSQEIYRILLEKGANIKTLSCKENSLLSNLVNSRRIKDINILLKSGVNPNIGKPSPLNKALLINDKEIVSLLLAGKGNPFIQDSNGKVPIIEAICRSTPEIVKMILSQSSGNIKVNDSEGFTPFTAALFMGDPEKIEALVAKDAQIPIKLSKSKHIFEHVLNRMVAFQMWNSLVNLIELAHEFSPSLEKLILKNINRLK